MVRISIGSWSSILEVTVTLVGALSWNTDGATAVGNTVREGVNTASLMSAGKTHGVVLSVNSNVLLVATLKLLDGGLNMLHTTFLAHLLTGVVAVKTGSIPVTWNWLGVEGDLGTEFLGNTVKKETSEPKVVTHWKTY